MLVFCSFLLLCNILSILYCIISIKSIPVKGMFHFAFFRFFGGTVPFRIVEEKKILLHVQNGMGCGIIPIIRFLRTISFGLGLLVCY